MERQFKRVASLGLKVECAVVGGLVIDVECRDRLRRIRKVRRLVQEAKTCEALL